MFFKNFLVVLSVATLFFSSSVSAEIINFKFTGTVTYGGTLATAGSQITGIFSYETKTLPEYSIVGNASYSIPAPFVISASVGEHAIVATKLKVSVWNNYGGNVEDMVDVYGNSLLVDSNVYPNGSFGFRVASASGFTNVLANTNLPLSFDVSAFNAGTTLNYGWIQSDGSQNGQLLQFTIDKIVTHEKCHRKDVDEGGVD